VAGAVAGASLKTTPANRHVAKAAVVAGGSGSPADVRRLAELVRLPYVPMLARQQLGESSSFDPEVSIEPEPELGMIVIRVAATSPEVARLFADALAGQVLSFRDVVQGTKGTAIPLGDFEDGFGPWLVGPRTLGPSTGNIRLSLDNPRFNEAALEVNCSRNDACGFSRLVQYPFRAGARYRFVGWTRGDFSRDVALIVGVADDTVESDVTLRERWQRHVVDWIPARDYQAAEVRWQAASNVGSFFLDGTWMADGAAFQNAGVPFPQGPSEAAVFSRADAPRALPAVAAGSIDAQTPRAAAVGALMGFLAGCIVLGLAAAIVRHR
jgi:hypothetical protein